jgi:uncharacterized protein (DUF2267 family)
VDYSEFIGQVQHRLEFGTQGKTVRAIRATLTTLGERVQAGEAHDLAGPLPMEIDWYVESADHGQRFDFDEFVTRVVQRENRDPSDPSARSDAVYHAQAIFALVADNVPGGEIEQVRQQLPDDENWDKLYELVDAEGAFD